MATLRRVALGTLEGEHRSDQRSVACKLIRTTLARNSHHSPPQSHRHTVPPLDDATL